MKCPTSRTVFVSLFLAHGLVAHGSAAAQIYMCKDSAGRTLSSDRPIAECSDRALRVLDKGGTARREIPAPLTAEQKRQLEREEEKRKAEQMALAEQRRNDRAIQMRYRSPEEIEVARRKALELIQENLKQERSVLVDAEKRHQQAQTEMNAFRGKSGASAVPESLQRKAEEAGQALAFARRMVLERQAELEHIDAKYDATLRRYLELAGNSQR